MQRKVIKLGTSTLVVSLPSKWAKEQGVEEGQEITLQEEKNELTITTDKASTRKKEKNISCKSYTEKDIEIILTHLYRKGFDKITFADTTQIQATQIRKIANTLLLGFEATERGEDYCIVENLAEPTEQKLDTLIKRILFIIKETQKRVLEDLTKNKYDLNEIKELRNQNDKFILYCRRQIITHSEKDSLLYWELLTFCNHIQHAYFYLHQYASKSKVKAEKQIIELLEESKKYFELYYEAYCKKDISKIHKITALRKQYQFGKGIKYIEQLKGKNAGYAAYMKEIFRLIQIGTSPIIGILLEEEK